MASLVIEVLGEGELFMKELIHINIKISTQSLDITIT